MTEPMAQRLRYGSPLHAKVRDALKARKALSEAQMADRHKKWERAEDDYRAYVPESVEDKRRKLGRAKGQQQYTTIVVSYSYASLLAAHTYWTSVFFSRSPIHQLTSRHGAGAQGVLPMESLLDYQVLVGDFLVPYYVWLMDVGKYGLGILGNYWATEQERISRIETQPVVDPLTGLPIEGRTQQVKITEELTTYQGNRVFNIRPYDWRPDPRVSISNFQKGEFCGYVTVKGWNEILKDRKYFNKDALRDHKGGKHNAGSGTAWEQVGSQKERLPAVDMVIDFSDIKDPGSTKLFEVFVELVPKDWGLDTGDYPEKWVFTVAEDEIIIGARPFGHYHNKYPIDVMQYEVDGYSLDQRGLMEIAQPVNDAMGWLVNSHFYNVRKALNDQIILDQSRLVLKDAEDGGPGKLIKLRPSAFGQDVRTMWAQIPVVDVTRGHVNDTQVLAEMMQRITGVNDNIMGQVNPGGRKTATEVRTSSTFGINRLKTQAEYFSAIGFSPLTRKLIANTQQYYDGAQKFRIAGNQVSDMQHIMVTPESIAGEFDFVPVDGTLPIDRFAQAALWKDFFATISQIPPIMMQYDLGKLFAYVGQLAGLKNINEFRIESMDQGMLQAQVQQGNLVPMGGANGGTRGTGTPSVQTKGLGAGIN